MQHPKKYAWKDANVWKQQPIVKELIQLVLPLDLSSELMEEEILLPDLTNDDAIREEHKTPVTPSDAWDE